MLSKLSIGLLAVASLFGLSKPANASSHWGVFVGPGYAPYYSPYYAPYYSYPYGYPYAYPYSPGFGFGFGFGHHHHHGWHR